METSRSYRPQTGGQGVFYNNLHKRGRQEHDIRRRALFFEQCRTVHEILGERYSPDKEKLLEAPIWVRLFGLPDEFWDLETLEGIGNTIRKFVKIAEATKRGKYNSFARICVYMNLAEPIPDTVEVEYHDEVWKQLVDYEHIPFRCRNCHEYDHLYKQCPLNNEEEPKKSQEAVAGGFQQVTRKRRQNKEGPRSQSQGKPAPMTSPNKFQVLQDDEEDYEINLEDDEDPGNNPMEIIGEDKEKEKDPRKIERERPEEQGEDTTMQSHMEVEHQTTNAVEEERIMRRLLQEWKYLDSRFIPEKQKQLYKEVFQKYKEKMGENIVQLMMTGN